MLLPAKNGLRDSGQQEDDLDNPENDQVPKPQFPLPFGMFVIGFADLVGRGC